jgi:hypothetical protein
MHDDLNDHAELSDAERSLFAALSREAQATPGEEERLVRLLAADGHFRRPARGAGTLVRLAAALVLFVAGGVVGAGMSTQRSEHSSIEALLGRDDLSLDERVLLLQRAGSAYVRAANGYAEATSTVDSAAIEVASQVLLGAAHAVARQNLDGGMTVQLAAMLQTPGTVP